MVTWDKQLSNYLAEHEKKPFVWGENDCMGFACRAVELKTGRDIYSAYAGYTTEQGAEEVLAAHGGIFGIIEKEMGAGTTNIHLARRGDIAVIDHPGVGLMAGVVDDTGMRIAVLTPIGLRRMPLTRAIRVWGY